MIMAPLFCAQFVFQIIKRFICVRNKQLLIGLTSAWLSDLFCLDPYITLFKQYFDFKYSCLFPCQSLYFVYYSTRRFDPYENLALLINIRVYLLGRNNKSKESVNFRGSSNTTEPHYIKIGYNIQYIHILYSQNKLSTPQRVNKTN